MVVIKTETFDEISRDNFLHSRDESMGGQWESVPARFKAHHCTFLSGPLKKFVVSNDRHCILPEKYHIFTDPEGLFECEHCYCTRPDESKCTKYCTVVNNSSRAVVRPLSDAKRALDLIPQEGKASF